jgi:PncC family amidohydrolase
MQSAAQRLGTILKRRGWSLALAESCTGGMVASAITDNAGASGYFKGGVVAYSNEIKERVLGVSRKLLQEKGAVSAEVVEEMAAGAARLYNAECCIALSGIAGPAGGSPKKPKRLVFIGICCQIKTWSFEYRFKGNRKSIREQATRAGLEKMIEMLNRQSRKAASRNVGKKRSVG